MRGIIIADNSKMDSNETMAARLRDAHSALGFGHLEIAFYHHTTVLVDYNKEGGWLKDLSGDTVAQYDWFLQPEQAVEDDEKYIVVGLTHDPKTSIALLARLGYFDPAEAEVA